MKIFFAAYLLNSWILERTKAKLFYEVFHMAQNLFVMHKIMQTKISASFSVTDKPK